MVSSVPKKWLIFLFQLGMNILGAADKAHGGHTESPFVETRFDCLDDFTVICQAKVIVGAHVQDLVFTHIDAGLLGGCDVTFGFIQAGVGDYFEFVFKRCAIFAVHDCLPWVL